MGKIRRDKIFPDGMKRNYWISKMKMGFQTQLNLKMDKKSKNLSKT